MTSRATLPWMGKDPLTAYMKATNIVDTGDDDGEDEFDDLDEGARITYFAAPVLMTHAGHSLAFCIPS